MTGIPLVPSEAPTNKLWRMGRRLYRILRALWSLCPSWILVLRMVVAYSLSCAYFVFEAVAVFPPWVSHTQCLLKEVAAAGLSLPLRVRNTTLYGTLASLGSDCLVCCPAFTFARCVDCSLP